MGDETRLRELAFKLMPECYRSSAEYPINYAEYNTDQQNWWQVVDCVLEAAKKLPKADEMCESEDFTERANLSGKLAMLSACILCLSPQVVGLWILDQGFCRRVGNGWFILFSCCAYVIVVEIHVQQKWMGPWQKANHKRK